MTRKRLGLTRVPLHSYFSLVAPGALLDVVADAKRAEALRLLRGRPEAELPILCTVAPFKAGGRAGPGNYVDIPPGPLAFRQAADLYNSPNTFCLLEVTGLLLRDWLERSAALFCALLPGETDQPLHDPDVPAYNFDTIDGLTWVLDLSQPARTEAFGPVIHPTASRIGDLRHKGRLVSEGDRFVLATSSYRPAQGGGYAAAQGARVLHRSRITTRDIVLSHVLSGPLDPAPRPRWRFAPMPGTAAWFDTGSGAARFAGTLPGRGIEPLGPTPEGFLRFRLRL